MSPKSATAVRGAFSPSTQSVNPTESVAFPALARATSNVGGRPLGTKGLTTRIRLQDAAKRLLQHVSPLALTPTAIAKEAGMSPGSFYVYFTDIRQLLLDLSADCGPRVEDLFPTEHTFKVPDRLHADARAFIEAFNAAWDKNATILLYRNLEADGGDHRFDAVRSASALPIVERFAELLRASPSAARLAAADAWSDAVVLFAAVERIAATTHRAPENGPSSTDLQRALIRLLTRSLS